LAKSTPRDLETASSESSSMLSSRPKQPKCERTTTNYPLVYFSKGKNACLAELFALAFGFLKKLIASHRAQ